MGNKFICESCGKEVDCGDKDPSNWKQKLCYDCRKAQGGFSKPQGNHQKPIQTYAKTPAVQKYEPKKEFSSEDYVNELLDNYEMLLYAVQGRNLEVPQESICAWATSMMIQKGKN